MRQWSARYCLRSIRLYGPSESVRCGLLLRSKFNIRGYAEIVNVPTMAESITEGTLKAFTKEQVEQDEEVATIETDKIDVSVNSPMAGRLLEFMTNPEDTVQVGQPLFKIDPGQSGSSTQSSEPPVQRDQPKTEHKTEQTRPTSEPITEKKIEPKTEPKPEPKKVEKHDAERVEPSIKFDKREERHVKMNRMRLRIAERLKESQNTAAALTTFNECDMSALLEMRKLYKDEILKKSGIKFGFMGAFSKAATLALREIPAVNAAIIGPQGGDTIVYRDYVDISVAVATPKGLVTPVIRNVEALDILAIEKAIAEAGTKARDGKLTLEDMAGGTFTISNGGVYGSLMGTPIINLPQSAVLGLHGVKERPVVVNGQVVARPMMYLALTYDHRLVDGREAVTFLKTIKELIEDPRRMLLF